MASRWAFLGVAALALGLASATPVERPAYTDCHNAYCVEPTWAAADTASTLERGFVDLTTPESWIRARPRFSRPTAQGPPVNGHLVQSHTAPGRPPDLTDDEWKAFTSARQQVAQEASRRLERRARFASAQPFAAGLAVLLGLVALVGGLRRRRRLRQRAFVFERRTLLGPFVYASWSLLALLVVQVALGVYVDLGPPPTPAVCESFACIDPSWETPPPRARIEVSYASTPASVQWWVDHQPPLVEGGLGIPVSAAARQAFEAARPLALAAEQQRRVNWNRHRFLAEGSRVALPYTGGLLGVCLLATLYARRRRGRHVLIVRDHAVVLDGTVHDFDDLDLEDVRHALRQWADEDALGPYQDSLHALVEAHRCSLAVRAAKPASDLSSLDVEAYIFDHPSHDGARMVATVVGRTTALAFAVTAVLGVLVFTPVGETPSPFACRDAACVEPAWADVRHEDHFLARRRAVPVAPPIDVQWWLDNRPPMDQTDFGVHVKDPLYRADHASFLAAREQLERHELWRRTRWSFLVRTAGYTRQAVVPAGLVACLLFVLWVIARRRVVRTASRQVTVGRHHVAIDGERIPYEDAFETELRDALRELRNTGFEGNRTLVVHRVQQLAAAAHQGDRDPDAERRLRGLAART